MFTSHFGARVVFLLRVCVFSFVWWGEQDVAALLVSPFGIDLAARNKTKIETPGGRAVVGQEGQQSREGD